jgi:hypothetical protein
MDPSLLLNECNNFILAQLEACLKWWGPYHYVPHFILVDEESRKALLTIICNGSTLIWHYVNLHGEYDFTQDIEEQDMLFDMDKILALKVAYC